MVDPPSRDVRRVLINFLSFDLFLFFLLFAFGNFELFRIPKVVFNYLLTNKLELSRAKL